MTDAFSLGENLGVSNIVIPKEGPRIIQARLDFSGTDKIEIESLIATSTRRINKIQGAYIDNADNPNQLFLFCRATRQRVTVPPFGQGYFPLLLIGEPRIDVSTTQGAFKVYITFYNVPIQAQNWLSNDSSPGTGLTDAELRAAPIDVSLAGSAISDYSLAMDATSQELFAVGEAANYAMIFNPAGNGIVTINLAGGDAIAGGAPLLAGQSFILDNGASNAITIAGVNGENLIAFGGA